MIETIKQDMCKSYKISYEELSEAKIILNNHDENDNWNGIYVPLQYAQFEDNSIIVSSFPRLATLVNTYIKLFEDDLFSENALAYLKDNLKDETAKMGLKPYSTPIINNDLYNIIYGIEDEKYLQKQKIQESTVQFLHDTKYKASNLSPGHVYFGTLIDGEIVSIVSTSLATLEYPEVKIIDIGVGTHENHRQKGYALSNIIAMSNYLLNNGHIVKYMCDNKNINSQKAALSSGFEKIAREYLYRTKKFES